MRPWLASLRRAADRASVRARMLVVVAAAMLPAVVIGWWMLQATMANVRTTAAEDTRQMAANVAAQVMVTLRDAEDVMGRIAKRPLVRALSKAPCDPVFADFAPLFPEFTTLSLRRPDASSVCSALMPPPAVSPVRASPWFKQAVGAQGFMAGDAYQGPVTRRWTSALTTPVRDDDNQVVGVLIMPLDLLRVNQRLFGGMPPEARIVVTGRDGRVLFANVALAAQVGGPPSLRVEPIDTWARSIWAAAAGQRWLGTTQAVAATGWQVAAALPEAKLAAAFDAARDRSVLLGGMALLISVVAALGLSSTIVRPARRLAAAAAAVASGDREVRTAVTGPAELREVSLAFNHMLEVRAQNEKALADSLARFKALTALSSDWYWEQDASFRFIEVSYGARGKPGLPAQRLLGRTAWEIEALNMDEQAWAAFRARLNRHEAYFDVELVRILDDGSHQSRSVSGIPVFDTQQRFIGYRGIGRDVTALKQAADLRAARDAAELANRSKSAFMSRVSHELRTPLNSILGFGQLLSFDADVQRAPLLRQNVDYVLTAGRHLLAMVDDLLDLAHAEADQFDLALKPVDVAALVDDCLVLMQPLMQARDIGLQWQRGQPRWVLADPKRLKQVVLNLLANAVKFNRLGGSVTLVLQADAAWLSLSVRDTGDGIAPDQLGALFQPFNRLGAAQRGVSGTGMGLVIAKCLVEAMGGTIAVYSDGTPGQGAMFSLRLPVMTVMPLARVQAAAGPSQSRSA